LRAGRGRGRRTGREVPCCDCACLLASKARRPAPGSRFRSTARSAAQLCSVEEVPPSPPSHRTVSPTSSPCSHQSSPSTQNLPIQILNPPKSSKSAPTTKIPPPSRVNHFHQFQPPQHRLHSATLSSSPISRLSIATMSPLVCPRMLMSTRCRPNSEAVP